MKIVTVVGARPQFIKAAMVSHELRKKNQEIIVHTGQHFDYNMSELFFKELDIPEPDYFLGISGGSHAQMTGKMMMAIEDVLVKEKPDWVLVYGDTNSTLAAALAGVKLCIPVCHVEAGGRTHNMDNPEEINRICTDHVSKLLLAVTHGHLEEMRKEGLADKGKFVGNPMYDAYVKYSQKIKVGDILLNTLSGNKISVPYSYYYLTCHRQENTGDDKTLIEIFKAMGQLTDPVIYPVHPRNRERAVRLLKEYNFENIKLVDPVGYLESICLVNHAKKIVTDSGGLQTEAFFAKKQCITILNFVCWPETMVGNRNQLAKPECTDILEKIYTEQTIQDTYFPFGDGHAGTKIVETLMYS